MTAQEGTGFAMSTGLSFQKWTYTTVGFSLGKWTLKADPRVTVEAQAKGGYILRIPGVRDAEYKDKSARPALWDGEHAHICAVARAAASGEHA